MFHLTYTVIVSINSINSIYLLFWWSEYKVYLLLTGNSSVLWSKSSSIQMNTFQSGADGADIELNFLML